MIYFAQAESGDMKIGFSENLRQRLQAVSCGHRGRVRLIATADGGRDEEQTAHAILGVYRIRDRGWDSEWFLVDTESYAWRTFLPLVMPGFVLHTEAAQIAEHRERHSQIRRLASRFRGEPSPSAE